MKTISRKRRRKMIRQWWRRIAVLPIDNPTGEYLEFCNHTARFISRSVGIPTDFQFKPNRKYKGAHP